MRPLQLSPLPIGSLRIWPPVLLAPMAGETGGVLRVLCRGMGAGMVCTELTSSHALFHRNRRTADYLKWTDAERPLSAQIFGAEPDVMYEAARLVCEARPDSIDINMGCWVPKVAKTGAGAALLRDLPLAARVMAAVVRGSDVPVTVKTRAGWDGCRGSALDLARAAEDAGVSAITIHGRTAQQGFTGEADWTPIRETASSVGIPVIGNGDVRAPADAERMFRETGCAAVMVGRAALGNPWIFREMEAWLLRGQVLPEPTAWERIEMAWRHARLLTYQRDGRMLAQSPIPVIARSQLSHYLHGLRNATEARRRITRVETLGDVEQVLADLAGPGLIDGGAAAWPADEAALPARSGR